VVEQSNFDDYEPIRIREMPEVGVHIVRSTVAPSGIGDDASFAATGKRLRFTSFRPLDADMN
jgi:isoquinoline 1-oxidoreductase subunit beta